MRPLPQVVKTALHTVHHALSRRSIPPFALHIFRAVAWTLSIVAWLVLRWFSVLAPFICFFLVWNHIRSLCDEQIPVDKIQFPRLRTQFVITLITIPVWGLVMMAGTLLFFVGARVWSVVHNRIVSKKGYQPLGRDLEDMPLVEMRERSRAQADTEAGREKSRETPRSKYRALCCCGLGCILRWSLYLVAVLSGVHMLLNYQLPNDRRFSDRVELANRIPKAGGYGKGEKVFIAAMFYNNEPVLPSWITEITKFINYVGTDNVFVSIIESHSGDKSAALLQDFERSLVTMNVSRRIITDESTLQRPDYGRPQPRIPYLAALRNLVMEPLLERGEYTHVVWSNDIFIKAEAIVELLNTRDGDYDYACGLDFGPLGLYDTWVIRDHLGRMVSTIYPYLFEIPGYEAIMRDEPARVFSCWNGIMAMRADPFIDPAFRSNTTMLPTTPVAHPLIASHPMYPLPANMTPATAPAIRFRASTPSSNECFSSECFLLPYDLRRVYGFERIYVNPRVVTAYEWKWYVWFKYILRHPVVRWWVQNVDNGNGMHRAQLIIGWNDRIWEWDGIECHPWFGEVPWNDNGI